jgi:hypothetical protein
VFTPKSQARLKALYAAAAGIAGLLYVVVSEATEHESAAVLETYSRSGSAAAEPRDKMQATNLERFANNGFDPGIPCFRVDCEPQEKKPIRERLLERFGQPENSRSWQEPNPREAGTIDEYTAWEYEGLTIITVTSGSPQVWLSSITLSSPRYKLRHGLKIGLPFSEFAKVIGEPSHAHTQSKDSPVYAPEWAWLRFKLDRNGRVREITWDYDVIH